MTVVLLKSEVGANGRDLMTNHTISMCRVVGANLRPLDYKSSALSTELTARLLNISTGMLFQVVPKLKD